MDMEMKKNLAVSIAISMQQGPENTTIQELWTDRYISVLDWLDEKGFLQEPKSPCHNSDPARYKEQKAMAMDDFIDQINAREQHKPEPTNTAMLKIEYPETYDDFSTFMSAINALVQEFTPALDQTQMVIMLRTEANLIEYAEEQGKILRGECN